MMVRKGGDELPSGDRRGPLTRQRRLCDDGRVWGTLGEAGPKSMQDCSVGPWRPSSEWVKRRTGRAWRSAPAKPGGELPALTEA